jgi:asparagine synthase (glutamine-hydrolysing)
MCGLVGCVGAAAGRHALPAVQRALAMLEHRGPDSSGLLVYGGRDRTALLLDGLGRSRELRRPDDGSAGVVLGHRRLAIIDPSPAGHQPMVSADERFAIALNGEIYNYLELRAELEGRGVRFRSRSDTEVLLAAWAAWGPACLPRLVGMFAFVVVDFGARRVTFARDPFGMKPLYYADAGGSLAFASEIRALLRLAGVSRRADPQRVYDYLDLGITDHGDRTMLADVRALPAAHYAELPLDGTPQLRPVCYWQPDLGARLDVSFDEAARRLRDLFVESVRLHLRTDTQVGTLLSGGIDSSAIVMAMREVAGRSLELHTFSYIGDHEAVNEEPWIDAVNTAVGAQPHKLRLGPEEWAADFDRLVDSQDEPFGTIAVYAQHRLFGLAREAGVRTVLDGQGGDELLGGYRWMWSARVASLLKRGAWRDAVHLLRSARGARGRYDPPVRDILLRAVAMCLPRAAATAAQRLARRDVRPWIDRAWARRHGATPLTPWWAGGRGRDVLREALWLGVRERTLPTLLRYEDRNSMAHSVEARLPFLTPALAELALALPESYLVAPNSSGKAVFRAAMRGLVPDVVLDRRDKVGFSVPIHAWIPRLPVLQELLEEAATLPAVNPRGLAPLLPRVRAGGSLLDIMLSHPVRDRMKYSMWVWRIAGLAAWVRRVGALID